jgi:hypothetical protein
MKKAEGRIKKIQKFRFVEANKKYKAVNRLDRG